MHVIAAVIASAKSWLRFDSTRCKCPRTQFLVEHLEPRDTPSAVLSWQLPSGGGEFTLTRQDELLRLDQIGGGTLFQANANASTIRVVGTASAETIHVDFGRHDKSKGLQVLLDMEGGIDAVDMLLSPVAEFAVLAPYSGKVRSSSYLFDVRGVEAFQVAGGSEDSLLMTDGPGEDTVHATPSVISMSQSAAYQLHAVGFWRARVNVNPTEINHATLEGSERNDVVVFAGKTVTLREYDFTKRNVTLNGFTHVYADADDGYDYDFLILRDSRLSDELTFRPNMGVLKRGDGIDQEFQGFERISFVANGGGNQDVDMVRLFDSSAAETFQAIKNVGIYLAGDVSFDLRFYNVNDVYLDGSAGGLNLMSQMANTFRVHATGYSAASQFAVHAKLTRATSFYWIKKASLAMRPDLAAVSDPLELAVKLRDWVHERTRYGANSRAWVVSSPFARFYATMVSRQEAVMCQGRAWVYRDLLIAFGITAREVSLFSKTITPNHATTEAFIDNRWIAMDSTFNVSFTNDAGELLSYAQMKNLGRWNIETQGTLNVRYYQFDRYFPYRHYLYRIVYPKVF